MLTVCCNRYPEEMEAHGAGVQQQEEDGGSNMSTSAISHHQSRSRSREALRREPLSVMQGVGGRVGGGGKHALGSSDTMTTTLTLSQVSGPGNCTTSSSHRGNLDASLSPQETTFSMTLGEDVPDCTAMDNFTFSSFSESILPLGPSQGHADSAWAVPSHLDLQGLRAKTKEGSGSRSSQRAGEQSFMESDSKKERRAKGRPGKVVTLVIVQFDVQFFLCGELSQRTPR